MTLVHAYGLLENNLLSSIFFLLGHSVSTNHTGMVPLKWFKGDLLEWFELICLQLVHFAFKHCLSRDCGVYAVSLRYK